jgi:hypothetical protein
MGIEVKCQDCGNYPHCCTFGDKRRADKLTQHDNRICCGVCGRWNDDGTNHNICDRLISAVRDLIQHESRGPESDSYELCRLVEVLDDLDLIALGAGSVE